MDFKDGLPIIVLAGAAGRLGRKVYNRLLTTTAADKTVGEVLSDPQWRNLGVACVREACAVAVAEGAKVDAEKVLAGTAAFPANMRSSMQKDVERHNPPELDAIAGPILRGGQRYGIEVPATEKLVEAVEQRAG